MLMITWVRSFLSPEISLILGSIIISKLTPVVSILDCKSQTHGIKPFFYRKRGEFRFGDAGELAVVVDEGDKSFTSLPYGLEALDHIGNGLGINIRRFLRHVR